MVFTFECIASVFTFLGAVDGNESVFEILSYVKFRGDLFPEFEGEFIVLRYCRTAMQEHDGGKQKPFHICQGCIDSGLCIRDGLTINLSIK